MNRYYLLMDYNVPIYTKCCGRGTSMTGPIRGTQQEKLEFYRDDLNLSLPKSYRLMKVDVDSSVNLYVCYYNIDVGHFLIGSKKRKNAYDLATVLRALFSLFYGWQPEEPLDHYFLQELHRIPRPDWDDQRMIRELNEAGGPLHETDMFQFIQGYRVMPYAFKRVPDFIKRVWGDATIIEALNHLLESRFLFWGFMVGSYYQCHYSKDRVATPASEMEKRYFEHRFRYETAFVAAFKGIERLLSVNDIKSKEVDTILRKTSYKDINPETLYRRYHEIFSGHSKETTYSEIITHFLKIRNVVAAHGNRNPPQSATIIEDNVFEIQFFLQGLLAKVIFPDRSF